MQGGREQEDSRKSGYSRELQLAGSCSGIDARGAYSGSPIPGVSSRVQPSAPDEEGSARAGFVFLAILSGLLGALVGFSLAGEPKSAALACLDFIVGGILGWLLRGRWA